MEERTYSIDRQKAYEKVLVALKNLGFREENQDNAEGKIIASTGVSLLSWGEKVTIIILQKGNETKISVASSSNAQLIDWGKNSDNEKKIVEELDSLIG